MASQYVTQGMDMQNPEAVQIMRRQKMAEQLMQQGQTPLQGQMVSGHFVAPSWTEHLAKGLQAYLGNSEMKSADQQQQALAEKLRGQKANEIGKFSELLQGTPADQLPADQSGPVRPAQGPDVSGAYKYAANAQSPELQQFGLQGMLTQAQQQQQLAQQLAQRQKAATMWEAAGGDPQKALAMGMDPAMVKTFAEGKNLGKEKGVVVNGQVVDPITGEPIGKQVAKQFDASGGGKLVQGPDGKWMPNPAMVEFEQKTAPLKAPQVNVNTKIENKASENLAGKVGDILKDSAMAAQGAAQVNDAANRVIQAVDSGKIIAGPLSGGRLSMAQVSQMLGIGGKDNAEVIANTRQAIRALSEMTLQGRKQMSGQGAITESESKLAERANSGDISDLTPAELKQLAAASQRASQWTIANHQSKLDAARKLPAGGELVPFYSNVGAPTAPSPTPAPHSGKPGKPGGAKFLGFE